MRTLFLFFLSMLFLGVNLQAQGSGRQRNAAANRGETLQISDFHSISLGINAVVSIRQGEVQEVAVQGPAELIRDLKRDVEDGVWTVQFESRTKTEDTLWIAVTMKRIEMLAVGGSGALITERPLRLNNKLELNLGGTGTMDLDGTAPEVRINLAGSGRIDAEELEAGRAYISVAGAGEVRLSVIQYLEASIAGSGKVWYNGPAQVKSSVAGSGFVRQIN